MTTTSILQSIANALACVAAHERDTWVCMGMALKSELGDAGFSLWDNWGQSTDNYNARDSRTVWKSLRANGGVTIRSLYRLAMDNGWTSECPAKPVRHAQRKALEAEQRAAVLASEQIMQQQHATAKAKAQQWWNKAVPVNADHPYLRAKGVSPLTARQWRKLLLIPIYANHELVNLQLIGPDGQKRFLRGGQVKGGYCLIGKLPEASEVLLCEGWATGLSLYTATGNPVLVAFNAGNLATVAETVAHTMPKLRVLVAGDSDTSGTGQRAADRAARLCHGRYSLPSFTSEQISAYQMQHGKAPSDFNDLYRLVGLGAVKQQLLQTQTPQAEAVEAAISAISTVELLRGDQVTISAIRWLWDGWLAAGKMHILAGAPGTGKTTIAMSLAATVTTGGRWPDGARCQRGSVLIWSGEDGPADTLAPRLMAAGADMTKVHFVNGVRECGDKRSFDPSTDIDALLTAVSSIKDARLLVIDPIVSAVSGDSHKNTEVRRALQPLADLASTLDIALLGITHFSKGSASRDPTERVTGSIAFAALARIVLVTAKKEGEDGDETILARSKSNIGPDSGGFGYVFEQTELPQHPGVFASRILWGDAVEGSARELLGNANEGPNNDVDDWLTSALAVGAMKSKDLKLMAESNGFSYDQLKRAKRRLGIGDYQEGFGKNICVWWRRTNTPIQRTEAHIAHVEHTNLSAPYALYGENHLADDDAEVF